MTLTRWQRPDWPTFEKLFTLRDEIDRLFETPVSSYSRASQFMNGWTPAIDLYEDKDNLIVKAELPGMTKENIEVSLHDGAISVSGERKTDKEYQESGLYRAERFLGRFQRTVTLPKPVKGDKVKASYKDGVLTVTLPKTEEAKPKQIEIKV